MSTVMSTLSLVPSVSSGQCIKKKKKEDGLAVIALKRELAKYRAALARKPTPPPPLFTKMPHHILLNICRTISPFDLLSLGFTCRTLKDYQEHMCAKVTTLHLTMSKPWQLERCKSRLSRRPFEPDPIPKERLKIYLQLDYRRFEKEYTWLLREFPNIENLEIVQWRARNVRAFDAILALLGDKAWSPNLRTFKLSCSYEHPKGIQDRFDILMMYINTKMLKLRHLRLEVHHEIALKDSALLGYHQVDLRVLQRLHAFYFYSEDDFNILLPPLKQFALPNAKLKLLSIANCINESTFLQLVQLNPKFTNKFCYLNQILFDRFVYWSEIMDMELVDQLLLVARHFRNLRSFWTYIGHYSVGQWTWAISKMKYLEVLFISKFADLGQEVLAFQEDVPIAYLTPIPAVKFLTIDLNFASHTYLASYLKPAHVFPNIEVIHIIANNFCKICNYETTDECLELAKNHPVDCWNKLCEPLKGCKKLEKVIIRGNEWKTWRE